MKCIGLRTNVYNLETDKDAHFRPLKYLQKMTLDDLRIDMIEIYHNRLTQPYPLGHSADSDISKNFVYSRDQKENWDNDLSTIIYKVNSQPKGPDRPSPFFLMHGLKPRNTVNNILYLDLPPSRNSIATEREKANL